MKSSKKLIFSLAALFLLELNILTATGQDVASDVLIFKDGTKLIGTVLSRSTADTVFLQLAGGHVLSLPMNRISEISAGQREKAQPKSNAETKARAKAKAVEPSLEPWSRMKRGYFNSQEFGFTIGESQTVFVPNVGISLLSVHGYQIVERFAIAAGLGVDFFPQNDDVFFPFFGRVSGDLLKKNITPFWFIDVGYSVTRPGLNEWEEKFGGLMTGTGIGVKFFRSDRKYLSLSLSYKYQESEIRSYQDVGFPPNTTFRKYQRAAVRFGFGF